MRKRKLTGILIWCGLIVLGVAGPVEAGELTKVRLAMGTPNIQPLAVNLAVGMELGYFREEGIDWSLVPIGAAAGLVHAVATRQTEMAVIVPGFLLPLAAKGDAPPGEGFLQLYPRL